MKQRITITLDRECLDWVDEKVRNRSFANRSHGFEFLIARFKERQQIQNILTNQNINNQNLTRQKSQAQSENRTRRKILE